MEIIIGSLLTSALGYILKAAAESETAKTAKEELLGRFWKWIRPKIIKDLPEIESKSDAEETQVKTEEKLIELIQDKDFFNELVKKVNELQQAGITEKNIVRKDIKRVRKIRIGDKEYNPNDTYSSKNIVEGNIEDADEFVLGDGY